MKQTFILETVGQYPKKIALDVWDDKIAFALNESVVVDINLESREYNGKWFTNATAWRKGGAQPVANPVQTAAAPAAQAPAPVVATPKPEGATLPPPKNPPVIQGLPPSDDDMDRLPF
jgi:hypothetical protein